MNEEEIKQELENIANCSVSRSNMLIDMVKDINTLLELHGKRIYSLERNYSNLLIANTLFIICLIIRLVSR